MFRYFAEALRPRKPQKLRKYCSPTFRHYIREEYLWYVWKPSGVDNHKNKQSFVHFYPENDKNKETPWHQDIDVNNASAIVLLSGDGKDEILTADTCPLSKPLDDSTPEVVGSFKVHTPKPGEALILGYRLHHAVPARNRTTERVVLVIWF